MEENVHYLHVSSMYAIFKWIRMLRNYFYLIPSLCLIFLGMGGRETVQANENKIFYIHTAWNMKHRKYYISESSLVSTSMETEDEFGQIFHAM